ncbi:class I SAM-dependent methyltransferase [Orrella sp. 11846]|uniref:class I SAM-dependent methyltransferase n=1 Tax=Orrella sp. 11846 TaxID=3409913 RepID=UPI003B5A7AD3
MPINFHDESNRHMYTGRQADQSWFDAMRALVDARGKTVVDIGCGGGIYSVAWAMMGARQVIGVDFSEVMLTTARETLNAMTQLQFVYGKADETGLPNNSADIVYSRALLHHLDEVDGCAKEAWRLLKPGGAVIFQERTPQDLSHLGSPAHLRGYVFDVFPHLMKIEEARRPEKETVIEALRNAGFEDVRTVELEETRRIYVHFEELAQDLRARKGRSILHALNDDELEILIEHIRASLNNEEPIIEKDRWTLWHAMSPN